MIYLDNNATTFLLPVVRARIKELIAAPLGNPSSPYGLGAEARALLEQARDQVAAAIGARSDCILFVASGVRGQRYGPRYGTDVRAAARRDPCKCRRALVRHGERRLLGQRGYTVRYVPVDGCGLLDLDQLVDMVSDRTAIVSVQWVNSETGVVQPVEEIAARSRAVGALYHCDAAQAFGKIPISVDGQGAPDLLTVTAHKINGPTGCAALYARDPSLLQPIVGGGDQEQGLRGGTENLIGAVGFGAAASERTRDLAKLAAQMERCRDTFEQAVRGAQPLLPVNGDPQRRVGNTSNLQFPGIDGAMLVAALDEQEIYCSQSSACTTSRPTPSHVLTAMGLSESEAYASLRFSFGVLDTEQEARHAADQVVLAYRDLLERLHRLGVA